MPFFKKKIAVCLCTIHSQVFLSAWVKPKVSLSTREYASLGVSHAISSRNKNEIERLRLQKHRVWQRSLYTAGLVFRALNFVSKNGLV